ncbi:MAG: DUF4097 family beta strand repeat-containing protein [Nitrososphaeria archaeon]
MKALTAAIIVFAVIAISLFCSLTIQKLTFGFQSVSGVKMLNSSNINAISISDPRGLVYIKAYSGPQIIVKYVSYSDFLSPLALKIENNNGVLLITTGQNYFNAGYSVNLNITVPESIMPDVTVKLGGGNVIVQLPYAGAITIEDGAGNVQINATQAVQMKVEVASGNVELWTSSTKYIYAAVTTGDINAVISGPLTGSYQFYATTGNLNVMIPPDSSVTFTVSTTAGAVVVEGIHYNSVSNSMSGIVSGTAGNGTATLTESTTTGNAYLKAI